MPFPDFINKKILRCCLQFLVTGLSIYVIASLIDWAETVRVVGSASPGQIVSAVAFFYLIRVVMALRWQYLLQAVAVEVSLWKLFESLQASLFLGNLMPAGSLFADLIRGYDVTRYAGSYPKVAMTLIADRIFGFFSMLVLALTGSLALGVSGEHPVLFLRLSMILAVAIVAFMFALLTVGYWGRKKRAARRELALPAKGRNGKFFLFVNDVAGLLDPGWFVRTAPAALLHSFCVQVLRCCMLYCLFRSVHAPVTLLHAIVFIPLLFLLLSVPLSIGGCGIREAILSLLFGLLGISAELSVSVGLLLFTVQTLGAMPFFGAWIIRRRIRLSGVAA